MAQGKIERWHLTLKNQILLENYYLPGDLKCAIADFVEHYNLTRVMNIIGVGPLIAAMREFLNVFFAQQPCPRFRSPLEPH
jgi:hypothetical protein